MYSSRLPLFLRFFLSILLIGSAFIAVIHLSYNSAYAITPEPAWAFPFAAGTSINIGPLGLHDHNFKSMQDDRTGTIYTFTNPRYSDASLDMVLQPEHKGTSKIPTVSLANGTVLAVWAACQLVLINHDNGWWAVYLHMANIQVVSGDAVKTGSIIGYPTTKKPTQKSCGSVESSDEHVHFAFLNGSGTTGTYVSMPGSTFCGYPVVELNNDPHNIILQGLTQQMGQIFSVPQCPGTITEFPLPAGNSQPLYIAKGTDGNLWFTEWAGNKIGKITAGGSLTEYPLPSSNRAPYGIVSGPDGNLWAAMSNRYIDRITVDGTITSFSLPNSNGGFPAEITVGPDGNLWFTEVCYNYWCTNQIGMITLNGQVTEYPIPNGTSDIFGITAGPDGNLWFSDPGSNSIAKITLSGTVTEYPVPTNNAEPWGITRGPDNNLWFTEIGVGKIGMINPSSDQIIEYPIPPTGNAGPSEITVGPDGNLWFSDPRSNSVAKITLSGTVTEYPIPTSNSQPWGIVTGPDKNVWFVEQSGNNIGKIVP